MGLRVNTNTASMTAQFHMRNNTKGVAKAMEQLSSGSRINKSSDDAAGMALSDNMGAHIRGLKQSERNAQDAISLTQVAEGNLSQVANMLVRLRELSMQCASDTISDDDRSLVAREFDQNLMEIDRIANSTEFNGTKLLNGSANRLDFQINTRNSDSVDRVSFDPSQADVGVVSLGINEASVLDKESAQESIGRIDNAINSVSDLRSNFGSIQSRMTVAIESIGANLENISAAKSRIKDTDIAEQSSEMAKNNLMLQAGTSILAQANQQPGQALSLLHKG